MSTIVAIIIALVIAGFVLWAARKILALLPLDQQVKQWIDVALLILVAAIIVFYVAIPLLQMLGHLSIPRF